MSYFGYNSVDMELFSVIFRQPGNLSGEMDKMTKPDRTARVTELVVTNGSWGV